MNLYSFEDAIKKQTEIILKENNKYTRKGLRYLTAFDDPLKYFILLDDQTWKSVDKIFYTHSEALNHQHIIVNDCRKLNAFTVGANYTFFCRKHTEQMLLIAEDKYNYLKNYRHKNKSTIYVLLDDYQWAFIKKDQGENNGVK